MSKPYLIQLDARKGDQTTRNRIAALKAEIAGLEKQLAAKPQQGKAPAKVDPVRAYENAIAAGDKKAAAALFKQHKAALFNSRQGKPFTPSK
jgi:hypothetical protein